MTNSLQSTREVIAHLGGTATVAKLLGVGRTAVANWAVTNLFPAKHYLAIKGLLGRGTSAPDSLFAMSTVRVAQPRARARA